MHLLDLAGAVQAFYEAGSYGHPYEILFVSNYQDVPSSSKLKLAGLRHFSGIKCRSTDIVIVPGFQLRKLHASSNKQVYEWLRLAHKKEAAICSVCTGAFALAEAGLLNNRSCTTHWMYTGRLQKDYPSLDVQQNKLFVKSDNVYTSAGVATGIDLALFLLEERHGAKLAYQLARELVVYIRRDGTSAQESAYLQHRQHINNTVHTVQDWIIHHLDEKITLEELAGIAYTSPRNLTRLFKITTGITVGAYIEKLRAEKAMQLLKENHKIESITKDCGFQSPNQLRHIVKKHHGALPSVFKALS